MEKLRDKKKHDHLLTKLLKASIFSIVMLTPFFAILSKIMYVSFNKNAYESYFGETINQKQYTNVTSVQNNELYNMNIAQNTIINSFNGQINIQMTSFNDLTNALNLNGTPTKLIMWYGSQFYYFQFRDSNNNVLRQDNTNSYVLNFDFKPTSFTLANQNAIQIYDYVYKVTYNKLTYIDNVFYYAVDQLDEMPLFNWTKNTALYTTINAMCSGLDVGTNILAILLTYWALMTAIYIVFDIIIELFTKLTHILA